MLKIKNLELKSAVIQSPMSGCTDLPFRLIAREKGLSFAFLEMILADAVVENSPRTRAMMRSIPQDRPLGAQLVGYTPESLGEAARILEETGFDLIDLNLGCPVRKVTCKGGGSAILKEPGRAKSIFLSMTAAVTTSPVTVKMRLGYDDPSGAEALKIAQIAEDCGISAVTIHGRTRSQGYSGHADYEAIGRIKKSVRIPVIGNGDVLDGRKARTLLEVSGCDGIMIGRGGIGNPWIYEEIAASLENRPDHGRSVTAPPPPSFDEIRSTLLRHMDLQIKHSPDEAPFLMRRIACGYFKKFPGAGRFRNQINATPLDRSREIDDIRRLIEEFRPTASDGARMPIRAR